MITHAPLHAAPKDATISETGLKAIMQVERVAQQGYLDINGVLTIGVGFTQAVVDKGERVGSSWRRAAAAACFACLTAHSPCMLHVITVITVITS